MYWFSINKILTEQEFNFLNGINKLFHKELCLLPKRARHFHYQVTPCPTPVAVERLFLWPHREGRAHSSPPADSPTLISMVQLVEVSAFFFCSSCFSHRSVLSCLTIFINFLVFLFIWDIQHFIDLKSYLFSATAFLSHPSPYPHPPCPFFPILGARKQQEPAALPGKGSPAQGWSKAGKGGTAPMWAQSHREQSRSGDSKQHQTAVHCSPGKCKAMKQVWGQGVTVVSQSQPHAWPGTGRPAQQV